MKPRTAWTTASAFATVALLSAAALAAGLSSKDQKHAGISGHTGKNHTLSAGPGMFLMSIEWSETRDEPCYLKATFGGYTGKAFRTVDKELNLCAKNANSLKTVRLHHPAVDYHLRAARSIEVCTSQKKSSVDERMKGIKLNAGIVDLKSAEVLADDARAHDHRTNCKRWHTAKACAPGQLATGLVVVEGYEKKSKGSIVGLGLDCSTPTKR